MNKKEKWMQQTAQWLVNLMNVTAANPGKTIRISENGIKALETTEPDMIIVGDKVVMQ